MLYAPQVAYLSIGSFFDDKKQTEDLQKLEAADRSRYIFSHHIIDT